MTVFYVIAALCGIAIAMAEVMSRYKDEPLKAIGCWWGASYLVFNGLLSLAGFSVLVMAGTPGTSPAPVDLLKNALLGGFGATTIMRTKLFNLKLEEGEKLSIGPDFIIETFLGVLDRQIDRRRAIDRADIVKKHMKGLDFAKVKFPLINRVTNSMRSITGAEKKELGEKVKNLEAQDQLSPQEKSYTLGFIVLDIAGDDFFKKMFEKVLGEERDQYKL